MSVQTAENYEKNCAFTGLGPWQISVENVALAGFRFNGTSSATIELEADVYNPTPHVIFLDEVDAVLFREGKEFARFALEDKPSVAADTNSKVRIPVRASVSDPISIISAGLNLSSWNLDDLVESGRSGGGRQDSGKVGCRLQEDFQDEEGMIK